MPKPMVVLLSVLVCLVLVCPGTAPAADAPAKIQVLLIAGDDVAPFHDWREISENTREVLVATERFGVRVCEDPAILESAGALEAYDVVVFTMFNRSLPMLSDAGKENLVNFVQGGKGFYVQHLASASYGEWEEFGKMCGRKWVMGTSGHGPRSVFECKIADKEHPITKGLEDFKIFDELYSKLQGDTPIQVLVTADSDFSEKTEPMVFTCSYGQGRCVHNAFGHDHKAIKDKNCRKLIARGVEWAATGSVAGD
ncbi:MAG TPA: ThuA domain-containing protein [Thermoguttaceae bacterium]|nr:ThuA domain-containing protein [Thermoguttaceae bacterium]